MAPKYNPKTMPSVSPFSSAPRTQRSSANNCLKRKTEIWNKRNPVRCEIDLRNTLSALRGNKRWKKWLIHSRLTCAGSGVAFTQFLRQLWHLAAYWFVAADESIFGDGVVLGSPERPIVILLQEAEEGGWTVRKGATCCGILSSWSWSHGKQKNLAKNCSRALEQVQTGSNSLGWFQPVWLTELWQMNQARWRLMKIHVLMHDYLPNKRTPTLPQELRQLRQYLKTKG